MQNVQARVPEFKLTPPQLLGMVDEITDRAARALTTAQAALSLTTGEAQEAVRSLLEQVKLIGFVADMSVADCSADLFETWGVDSAVVMADQPADA